MSDEAKHIGETLNFTKNLVLESSAADRVQICEAFDAGLRLIAELSPPGASPRPGIEACILQHRRAKDANDVACAGWILAAMSARVDEEDLPNWRALKTTIDTLGEVLGLFRTTSIH